MENIESEMIETLKQEASKMNLEALSFEFNIALIAEQEDITITA